MAISLLNVVWELFNCFANDIQTLDKRALQRFIVQKRDLLQPLYLAMRYRVPVSMCWRYGRVEGNIFHL
jgi:hypothetical protein